MQNLELKPPPWPNNVVAKRIPSVGIPNFACCINLRINRKIKDRQLNHRKITEGERKQMKIRLHTEEKYF